MLRTNQDFDEIRVVNGIAERTGNKAERKSLRGRHDVCKTMNELTRKLRENGDGYFYLASSMWPEGETAVDLTKPWKTIAG